MNAEMIFNNHLQKKLQERAALKDALEAAERTITAGMYAGDGLYTKEICQAKKDKRKIETALEEAMKPIPLGEGQAAWAEHLRHKQNELERRIEDYIDDREGVADDLRLIFELYADICTERGKYRTACQTHRDSFPVPEIRQDFLQDISFYRQTGDFTQDEAELYTLGIKVNHDK